MVKFAEACRAVLILGVLLAVPLAAGAQPPVSLKQVPVPKPDNLASYVQNEAAAIRLGKALFWDMQVGSDGVQACASCHFHAGTDNRVNNTTHPGPADGFELTGRANGTLTADDFPLRKLADRHNRGSGGVLANDPAVLANARDAVGAQGVPLATFQGLRDGQAEEKARTVRDKTFTHNGRNVRQVTGRNAPSVINSVFNFANFWDGRANHYFNGVNPFGVQDPAAGVWVSQGATLEKLDMTASENLLNNASLASQAVGPPMSSVEMSWEGRSFPQLGRKMLGLTPLGKQLVHPSDSVLGPLSNAAVTPGAKGLATTYREMIQAAFWSKFWESSEQVEGFSQMEANFALFFGLAVQLYESTLVADDTPFDRFLEGDINALSDRQQRGLSKFFSGGFGCAECHIGPELTGASVSEANAANEPGLIEVMNMADGLLANYDIGFYNIGARPTGEDVGRGGLDPFDNPLSFSRQSRILVEGGSLPFAAFVPTPGCLPDLAADPPLICPPDLSTVSRVAVDGAFKTPGLRNVELTGPYFHHGGAGTLMQVLDFYIRGGDFHEANIDNLDPLLDGINSARGPDKGEERREVVDFLLSLTDERVRWEMAPFDHPELSIPDGHSNAIAGNPKRTRVLETRFRTLPAVGSGGRAVQGLGPLKPFLADELEGDALQQFHFGPDAQ